MPLTSNSSIRHARRIPRRHVLRAVAVLVLGVLSFTGAGAYALYQQFTGNISSDYSLDDYRDTTTAEPTDTETTPTDPKAGQAYNILLIGSDSREGENAEFGDVGGARADTTILVHVSADRTRVEAVSIPRDLLTDIPACQMDADGTMSYGQSNAMFNEAFYTGAMYGDIGLGAVCTSLTVENLTGLTIDDFAVVDFVGFERMVDTIGGVPMCIPEDMQDADSGLDLKAGEQTLNGTQALALARARHLAGTDGSDISRIGRQQELMAAVVRQVLATNPFTDTVTLIKFLDAVTSSLTTSTGLSNPIQLAGLAMSVAPVGADGVTFVTMPFAYAGARVVTTADTEVLWERLRNDEPVNSAAATTTAADPAATGTAGATDGATTAPATGDATAPATTPEPAATDPWDVTTGSEEAVC